MLVQILIGRDKGEVQDLPAHAAEAMLVSGQAAMVDAAENPTLAAHPTVQLVSEEDVLGDEDEGEDEGGADDGETAPKTTRRGRGRKRAS